MRPIEDATAEYVLYDNAGRRCVCYIDHGLNVCNFRVYVSEIHAAMARCSYISDSEWRLDEIMVFSDALKPHLWWHHIPFLKPKPIDYRKRGIGTALLKIVINEAQAYDIKLLHGSVTNGDLKNNPHLLEWYQKHGFELREPTPEAFLIAFKRIECNLSSKCQDSGTLSSGPHGPA